MLDAYGKSLIGKRVLTESYGAWPGGVATVTRVKPDRRAREIVFNVSMPSYEDGEEIGVFEHENVEFA